jgi:hypothetical protein
MIDVRHYYDVNITLLKNCSIFLLKGDIFVSPHHYVRNMINESSSKCDISLNHISRGRVEHLIMFCFSFRALF